MALQWMAWTWQTSFFFAGIAIVLCGMIIWERISPGGAPRRGILRITTTRGDRLFVSLLGSAYILMAWLGLTDANLWWAVVIAAAYSVAVFRYV